MAERFGSFCDVFIFVARKVLILLKKMHISHGDGEVQGSDLSFLTCIGYKNFFI